MEQDPLWKHLPRGARYWWMDPAFRHIITTHTYNDKILLQLSFCLDLLSIVNPSLALSLSLSIYLSFYLSLSLNFTSSRTARQSSQGWWLAQCCSSRGRRRRQWRSRSRWGRLARGARSAAAHSTAGPTPPAQRCAASGKKNKTKRRYHATGVTEGHRRDAKLILKSQKAFHTIIEQQRAKSYRLFIKYCVFP